MDILDFTRGIARDAGQQLLDWQSKVTAEKKADGSLVTEADVAVDRYLTEQIQTRYPDDAIISEELSHDYKDSEATWVIDPLDGTTNFTLGLHFWGVSIARITKNQPTMAVLYFPVVDEMYHACKGQGAFENNKQIHTDQREISRNTFLFKCSRTMKYYSVDLPCKNRMYGSAAYSLCALARGNALIDIDITPRIWDIAAGWLIAEEAGGYIDTLDSSKPFDLAPTVDYPTKGYPVLAAANQQVWNAARAAITPRAYPRNRDVII